MELENALNKKKADESKICMPHRVLLFSNPLSAYYIPTKVLSECWCLALTLTVTLFYVQTRGSPKIWPWLYQPHLFTGEAVIRAAPPPLCGFQ